MFVYNKTRTNVIRTFLKNNFNTKSERIVRETHYDVLGLSKNCKTKDIRDAFIKLSKQYHPDKTSKQGSQTHFVKVLEAYNILSKPTSRRQYDWELQQISIREPLRSYPPTGSQESYPGSQQSYPGSRNRGYGYNDPSFWANRDKTRDRFYQSQPYYGVHGIPKLSNGIIAVLCLCFTLVGAAFQYFAIRHSFALKRDFLKQRSDNNEMILSQIRTEADNNDRAFQIELVEKRFMNNKYYPQNDTKD